MLNVSPNLSQIHHAARSSLSWFELLVLACRTYPRNFHVLETESRIPNRILTESLCDTMTAALTVDSQAGRRSGKRQTNRSRHFATFRFNQQYAFVYLLLFCPISGVSISVSLSLSQSIYLSHSRFDATAFLSLNHEPKLFNKRQSSRIKQFSK